jgi:hypothetical protein
MLVKTRPTLGAEFYQCTQNVAKKIKMYGGEPCHGWLVTNCGWYTQRQAHCVWRDPEGFLWDVTLYPKEVIDEGIVGEFQDIEFEPDDSVKFDTQEECPPTQYTSNLDNAQLHKALELLAKSDLALVAQDLQKCCEYTEAANALVRLAGEKQGFVAPESLETGDLLKMSCPVDSTKAKAKPKSKWDMKRKARKWKKRQRQRARR